MSCYPVRASCALLIGPEDGGVLLVDRSTHINSRVGALICPAGLALRSDCAELQVEVECDLMKRSRI
jgi:hypothetical protein